MQRKTRRQPGFRPHRIQNFKQHVRTVFGKEIITGPGMADFPQMRHQHFQFGRRKIQLHFPNVPVLDVVVHVDDVIIRLDRPAAVITAGKPLDGIQQSAFRPFRKSAVTDAVGQKLSAFARRVNSEQRMAEQGRRIVHVSIGKQKRGAGRAQIFLKPVKLFTFYINFVDHSFVFKKYVSCGETTDLVFVIPLGKQANGCLQLRRRVRPSVFRQIKIFAVNGAATAGKNTRTIMDECQPLRIFRQPDIISDCGGSAAQKQKTEQKKFHGRTSRRFRPSARKPPTADQALTTSKIFPVT